MIELYKKIKLKSGKIVMPIEVDKEYFIAIDADGKNNTYSFSELKEEKKESSNNVITIKPTFIEDSFFEIPEEKEVVEEKEQEVKVVPKVEPKKEVKVIQEKKKEIQNDGFFDDEYDI